MKHAIMLYNSSLITKDVPNDSCSANLLSQLRIINVNTPNKNLIYHSKSVKE